MKEYISMIFIFFMAGISVTAFLYDGSAVLGGVACFQILLSIFTAITVGR